MKSMTCLTASDQHRIQFFARQAAVWFRLFDDFTQPAKATPPKLTTTVRLDIIFALHNMNDFRDYVHTFIKNDDRITAFEDAVAEAVYHAVAGQQVGA